MATLAQLRALLATRNNLAAADALARPELDFRHVAADHRAVKPGSLFLARQGLTVNSHERIPAALAAGAAAVMGAEAPSQFQARCRQAGCAPVPYLQVRQCQSAFAQAAALACGFPARRLTTVGVTGTNGKTTTLGLLASILQQTPIPSRAGDAGPGPPSHVGVISTVGIACGNARRQVGLHVTTPNAWDIQRALADMVAEGCQYALLECTSHGLDQRRADETELDVAGVTRITHEHLDYHGSFARYVEAKCGILDLLADAPGACVAVQAEDAAARAALAARARALQARRRHAIGTMTYGGAGAGSDYVASAPEVQAEGLRLAVRGPGLSPQTVQSSVMGHFNGDNILLACALGHALGATPAQIRNGVKRFPGVPGRMQRIEMGQAFLAIVDFAHTPHGLECALSSLRRLLRQAPRPGKLIAVFGSAGRRDTAKRALMGEVGARLADHVIVTAEDPRTEDAEAICREIVAGMRRGAGQAQWDIVPDRAGAMERAVALAAAGDVVAALGKGHEQSMCFGETEYAWSDQIAMESALRKRLGLPLGIGHEFIYGLPSHAR